MARELILKISCSRCQSDIPEEDPAYDVPVVLRFGVQEGKLDLCKACREQLEEALQPFLNLVEKPPPKKPAIPSSSNIRPRKIIAMICPRCDKQVTGSATPLRNHLIRTHGYSRDNALKEIPLGQAGLDYETQHPQLASRVIRGG